MLPVFMSVHALIELSAFMRWKADTCFADELGKAKTEIITKLSTKFCGE